MNRTEDKAVRELAALNGIQLSYTDATGQQQQASPDTLRGVLKALGTDLETEGVDGALHRVREARWSRGVEPVVPAWEGKRNLVSVRLPERAGTRKIECILTFEDGDERRWFSSTKESPVSKGHLVGGQKYVTRTLNLPEMNRGYHRLTLLVDKRRFETLIIAAPERTYAEPGAEKQWGVFLPMYAARTRQSWGAGNLSDWQRLTDWVGSLGGNFVGSLPVLTAFLGYPVCEPGPYSPASRLFWNEFYVDVAAAPELENCAAARRLLHSPSFRNRLRSLRRGHEVKYAEEMAAKRQVLERLSEMFFARDTARREAFEEFRKERPELDAYAEFRAACEQARASWHTWPEGPRGGSLSAGEFNPKVADYYRYAQWLTQEQMGNVLDHGREKNVKFYLDLPLGVNSDSFDLWRERASFSLTASAGAPPDPFFSKGQDWGFAPLHPNRIRELGYGYVRQFIRFQMRHTQMLRIDHVMGLHRLYWVPHGLSPTQGAYVTYPAEELYALLSLESHRHKTMLVGENLGTVPPEVNAGMARHGLRQMFVVQFEQRPQAAAALRDPPTRSVASVNTHDMPTFAAHWRGLDIADRADLGLIPKSKIRAEQENRKKLNLALGRFLQRKGFLPRGPLRRLPSAAAALGAILNWLGESPAEMVLVNLEDLWLEPAPQNVPGTSTERPNWRRKARLSLAEIQADRTLRAVLLELSRRRKKPLRRRANQRAAAVQIQGRAKADR